MTAHDQLTEGKLESLKNQLLEMKQETEKLMKNNQTDSPNDAIQELADYDNHPADMGTEQFEQERDAGLKLVRKDRMQEIENALEKIEHGTYGLSEKSGKPIPVERLEAQPTARNLVEEE
ncbi:hypothetical protein CIL03_09585 [Virgibacillus indicus]|uniref:Uncharacterized protein n=1 Tax=Virgibacillus indicus TaxID=2024554 RepID=A0A265NB82_9BACI|nr:hypothetical protein [Virgibacillus indicus]OZU88546.1 hypothetical protein CIL03_09585 [Virgibacillus indicus]